MNFLMKGFLSSTAAALLVISSFCFATNVPTSDCANYLNYSDSQFINLVSNDKAAADSVAKALNSCALANVCNDINTNGNCSALLATRSYISTYFANFNGASSFGSTKKEGGATPPPAPKSPVPSVTSGNSTNNPISSTNTTDQSPPTQAGKNESSNIHWF